MSRTLAIAALTLGLATTFVPAASAAPGCDIAQNCVCETANKVLKALGQEELICA